MTTLRRSPSNLFARIGTVTLVAGVRQGINAGCLTEPDKCTIIISRNTPGGTLGFLFAPSSSRGPGVTTFDILSNNGSDVSTVNWMAIPKDAGMKAPIVGVNDIPADGSLRKPPSGLLVARGTATLVAGTRTVTVDKPLSAESRIYVTANTLGGTAGKLSAPGASVNVAAGTFVINSDSALDTSTVDWVVFDQPLRFAPSGPLMGQANGTFIAGLATIAGLNPSSYDDVSVLASYITLAGNNGNISAPARAPSVTNGSIGIAAGNIADISTFECALF